MVLLALLLNLLLYIVLFLNILLFLAVGQLGPRMLLLCVLRDGVMPAGARAQAREAASLLRATPAATVAIRAVCGSAPTSIVLLGLVG